jgi:hypothetical protein
MRTHLPKFKIAICFIILTVFLTDTLLQAQNLLDAPQKIVLDARRNRLLVSNYHTGDIVQIDSAGNQSYFVQGAGFVDGLEIVGDTIYGVGNNRVVRAYNLVTKQLVMNITFSGSGSNYLSSITSDSSGHLFISCPALNTIYKLKISDGSYWVFVQNGGLNRPNGILLERDKNRIVVIDDSPGSSIIHAISLLDSTVSTLTTTTFNSPDGIVKDKFGNYYVGGYYLPGIYKFNSSFSQTPVIIFSGTNMVYPTYDYNDHSLLVTYYSSNSWARISLSTGINDPEGRIDDFKLNQNYPNPFNPSTKIKFQIKKNCFVLLKVYDILGKDVATLVNKKLQAGTYEVTFNAKEYATGIYFYTLSAGGFVDTKKMLMIK